MKIELLEEAELDLARGADFHESRSPGLGAYFVDCLSSDIGSLRLFAGTHNRVHCKHRLLSKRFPYSIYYDLIDGQVVIFGVFCDRQNPETIQSSLENRTTNGD